MRISFTPILLISLAMLYSPENIWSQGCPACSNPALQSSEKLEAGRDTLERGALRATINVTNGYDYQGGHPHAYGLSPEGLEIDVPLHEHQVSLDFLRTELSLEYTFNTNWSVWFRIPYDIKKQEAFINYIEPVTDYEKEAILRNRDIHHRSETYSGLSDLRLLLAHRLNGFISENGRLDMAFGTSLPIGKTEENPLEAGNEGRKHLHIQFGSGTFDPLLELHYTLGLTEQLSMAIFTINKISLYQNSKNYRGPYETTNGFSIGYKVSKWMTPRLTFANFTQTQARWEGKKDPNSGLVSYNLTANLTFTFKNGLTITPAYRHPLAQQTLSHEGDTFEYGPTFLLNVSALLNNSH